MDQNQPPQPAAPLPQQPVQQFPDNPGQTLGIVGLVLCVLHIGIVGIILGVISRNKSKEVGASTAIGTASMITGIVLTTLYALYFMFWIFIFFFAFANASQSSGSSSGTYDSTYQNSL